MPKAPTHPRQVRLRGLKSATSAKYNGVRGEVVAFSRANGRFTVKLDQYDLRLICPEGKTLRLLPTNLQACDKAAASS